MKIHRLASSIGSAVLVTTVVAFSIPAQAAVKPSVTANTTCSMGSVANLQVQREDTGKLSVDFGVDSAKHVAGVNWTYRVTDNRSAIMKGVSSTAADGSFSVTQTITPRSGANYIVATARNRASGEICRIKLSS